MRNELRELYHHGIEGQKWGVRNGPPYPLDESDKSSAEKRADSGGSEKNSYGGSHSGRPLSQMSDRELQDYVSRLNMEQQYTRLTAEPDQRLETVRKVSTWLKEFASIAESYGKLKTLFKPLIDKGKAATEKKKSKEEDDYNELKKKVERLELENRFNKAKADSENYKTANDKK